MADAKTGGSHTASQSGPLSNLSYWFDCILILTVALLLWWWSWGKWPDPFVDFGRELYIPWRLTTGDSLYSNLAYFNGPFSPYFNAFIFRALGVSILSMVAVNFLILAAVTGLIYFGMRWLSDRSAAVVGSFFFLAVFAFAQYLEIGNFNFVTPYSHEMTHGTLLSLTAMACLAWYLQSRLAAALAISVFCMGLVFLTKAEFFLAVATGVTSGLCVDLWLRRSPAAEWIRTAVACLVGVVSVPLAAFLLLLSGLPPQVALRGVLGSWLHLSNTEVRGLYFYRNGLGIDNLRGNLEIAAAWTFGLLAFFGFGAMLGLLLNKYPRLTRFGQVSAILLPVTFVFGYWLRVPWAQLAKPLPLLLTVAILLLLRHILHRGRSGFSDPQTSIALALSLFSLALLSKMLFNTRLFQYGFALAVPGSLVLIMGLVYLVPRALERKGVPFSFFKIWAISAILAVAALHLLYTHQMYRLKTVPVGTGADTFLAEERGLFAQSVLEVIESSIPPGATLAVLPEGVMVNYLARLVNPTSHINFMPPELALFGEEAIVAAFRSNPPDYVLLVNRPADEYGLQILGRGYGMNLMSWIESNYQQIEEVREPSIPGQPFSFGLLLGFRPSGSSQQPAPGSS